MATIKKIVKTIAKSAPAKSKRTARSAEAQKTVSAAVAPAVSVQTAKLSTDHGYYHIGADGKPDKSEPVTTGMNVVRAMETFLLAVGNAGISVSQLRANVVDSYGKRDGKITQQLRVWTQLDNGTRLAIGHSDYRKNPLCELIGKNASMIRFKTDRSVRHNHTSLTAVETVRLAKQAKKS